MTTARELGHLERPPDYTPEPSEELKRAESTLRIYRLSPEEAARYPVVRPTRQDFKDAADQGWSPTRFVETYGRDPRHRDQIYRAYQNFCRARDRARAHGDDPDRVDPVATISGAGLGSEGMLRRRPQVSPSWVEQVRAVICDHPDWTGAQIAGELGWPVKTLEGRLNRSGLSLSELREQVRADPEAATEAYAPDKAQEVNDDMPKPTIDDIRTALQLHPDRSITRIAKGLGSNLTRVYEAIREAGYSGVDDLRRALGLEPIQGRHGGKPKPIPPPAPPIDPSAEPPELEEPPSAPQPDPPAPEPDAAAAASAEDATKPQRCRECGCTDDRACPGGCWWVEPDLCSRCAGVAGEGLAGLGDEVKERPPAWSGRLNFAGTVPFWTVWAYLQWLDRLGIDSDTPVEVTLVVRPGGDAA